VAKALRVAIVGAGMGGLTAAATLRRAGIDAEIYEQAPAFSRLGAGIQMSPNAVKVLRAIGLEDKVRDIAFRPERQFSRVWDSGDVNLEYPFGDTIEERCGAPYLLMHRGDLHALLTTAVPDAAVHRSKKLVDLEQAATGVRLVFEDGSTAEADAVIGADGVHSRVRELLFGREAPHYSGRVAHRSTFPAARLNGKTIDDCTKWWGEDRHIVVYYTTRKRDEIYFVTSVPEPAWTEESWSLKADVESLRAAFTGFHPTVKMVLDACPEVHKWAIFERDPMAAWSKGRTVLIGDACHPMTPYMAQGAATAMEDAAVLARCLEGVDRDGITDAFATFEATRKERTSKIQHVSHMNVWLHRSSDTDWVFAYDPWNEPLAKPPVAALS